MNEEFSELVLACASWQEAQKIADAVLVKHLAMQVEFLPVKSDDKQEVKLIMQTTEPNFAKIESIVQKLRLSDSPVWHAYPIVGTAPGKAKSEGKERR